MPLMVKGGEKEGASGLSGRDSIVLFRDFYNRYSGRSNLINIDKACY